MSGGNEIKIWDLRIGRLAYEISAHSGCVNSVKFSRCGEYFGSGGIDSLVTTWNSNFSNQL